MKTHKILSVFLVLSVLFSAKIAFAMSIDGATCTVTSTGSVYQTVYGSSYTDSVQATVTCTVHSMSVEDQQTLMAELTGNITDNNTSSDDTQNLDMLYVMLREVGGVSCSGENSSASVSGQAGSVACSNQQSGWFREFIYFSLTMPSAPDSDGGTTASLPSIDSTRNEACQQSGDCFTAEDTYTFTATLSVSASSGVGERAHVSGGYPSLGMMKSF